MNYSSSKRKFDLFWALELVTSALTIGVVNGPAFGFPERQISSQGELISFFIQTSLVVVPGFDVLVHVYKFFLQNSFDYQSQKKFWAASLVLMLNRDIHVTIVIFTTQDILELKIFGCFLCLMATLRLVGFIYVCLFLPPAIEGPDPSQLLKIQSQGEETNAESDGETTTSLISRVSRAEMLFVDVFSTDFQYVRVPSELTRFRLSKEILACVAIVTALYSIFAATGSTFSFDPDKTQIEFSWNVASLTYLALFVGVLAVGLLVLVYLSGPRGLFVNGRDTSKCCSYFKLLFRGSISFCSSCLPSHATRTQALRVYRFSYGHRYGNLSHKGVANHFAKSYHPVNGSINAAVHLSEPHKRRRFRATQF